MITKKQWRSIRKDDVLIRCCDGLERKALDGPTWPSGAVTLKKIGISKYKKPTVTYFWNDLKRTYELKQNNER